MAFNPVKHKQYRNKEPWPILNFIFIVQNFLSPICKQFILFLNTARTSI